MNSTTWNMMFGTFVFTCGIIADVFFIFIGVAQIFNPNLMVNVFHLNF